MLNFLRTAAFFAVGVVLFPGAAVAADYHDRLTDYAPDPPEMPEGWVEHRAEIGLSERTVGGNEYTQLSTPSGNTASNASYAGEGSGEWSDYTARLIGMMFQGGAATPGMSVALTFRVDTEQWNRNYAAFVTSGGEFGIGRDFAGYQGGQGARHVLEKTSFSPRPAAANGQARPYLIEVHAQGETLTAKLYQAPEHANAGGWNSLLEKEDRYAAFTELLATVTVEDDRYATGSIGINTSHVGGNRFFRAMEASAKSGEAAAALGPTPANVAYSAEFELDLETLVLQQGWELPGEAASAELYEDPALESQAMRIRRDSAGEAFTRIRAAASKGDRLGIAALVRADGVEAGVDDNGGAMLRARFVDARGEAIGEAASTEGLNGTTGWRRQTFELRSPAPEGTAHVEVALGLSGSGVAAFDDLRVYRYDRPEFTEMSPSGGTIVDAVRPELSWVSDFQRYRVALSSERGFPDGATQYLYTGDSPIRPNFALRPGGTYFWRVLPWRADRAGFAKSSPSAVQSFRVSQTALLWPPRVQSLAWKWAEGPRREFAVRVSPNDASFEATAYVEGVEAEFVRHDGDERVFRPSSGLEPGVHDLRVVVRDGSGRVVEESCIVNNAEAGLVTRIDDEGFMRVDGERFFPIGAYRDLTNELLRFEGYAEARWNIAFSYYSGSNADKTRQHLDKAHDLGLKVMLRHPGGWGYLGEHYDRRRHWVARFSQHPALAAWYLADEPELYGFTMREVTRMAEVIKAADPHTVTTMVSHFMGSFGRLGDVFMHMNYIMGPFFKVTPGDPLDARKIYHGRLQGFGRAQQLWNLPTGEVRPQWAILQGFDPHQRKYRGGRDAWAEGVGLPDQPTPTETRCMVFSSIAYGAKGIFFWYFPPDSRYHLRDETVGVWDGIVAASHEVRDLEPFLVASSSARDGLAPPDPLLTWTRERHGERVLAVINPQVEPVEGEIDLSRFGVDRIGRRGVEGESVSLRDGRLVVSLDSHEVRLYQWDVAGR